MAGFDLETISCSTGKFFAAGCIILVIMTVAFLVLYFVTDVFSDLSPGYTILLWGTTSGIVLMSIAFILAFVNCQRCRFQTQVFSSVQKGINNVKNKAETLKTSLSTRADKLKT